MCVRLLGFALLMVPLERAGRRAAGLGAGDSFEKQIRPLLANHCWKCHGREQTEGRPAAGLRGRGCERRGFRPGHRCRPARGEPSHPGRSLPGRSQDASEGEAARCGGGRSRGLGARRRDLADRRETRVRTRSSRPSVHTSERTAPFWAFQPPRDPSPPDVQALAWPRSPIDRFILAALERKGLGPAPPAEKRTLIRRATFDLIGLPPDARRSRRVPRGPVARRLRQGRRPAARRRRDTASAGGDTGSTWHATPTPTAWTRTSRMPTPFATAIT